MNVTIDTKYTDYRLQPQRAHPTDAGADLRSAETWSLQPGSSKLFDTGVAVKIPQGFVGLVFNRSSQGKLGIKLANSVGVIDTDYRGNIKVLLENHKFEPYEVVAGKTRIAQLVIVPVLLAEFKIVENEDKWNNTQRGENGFGSTGA